MDLDGMKTPAFPNVPRQGIFSRLHACIHAYDGGEGRSFVQAGLEALEQSLSMAPLAPAAAKALKMMALRCPTQRFWPFSKPVTARPLTVGDSDQGKCYAQAAIEVLEQSLSKAPLALAAAKAAVDDGFEVPLPKGLAFERAHYTRLFATDDRLEALRAFAEKRKPTFRGC